MSHSATTSSGQPLRILALDGGGVRGLSELVVLKSIMDSIRFQLEENGVLGPDERLRPCDFFDLICGTSTGGLIALMLGRLQMVRVQDDFDTDIRLFVNA
jgi:patatin-like phospholipase/acyl hydrolase